MTRQISEIAVTMLLIAGVGLAQQTPADDALAVQYFREARAASHRDHGVTWNVPLYGPILFVDPKTRTVTANQADKEGKLERRDGVFRGKLPPEVAPANTAVRWAGVEWTMVMWPLPEYRQDRVRLLMHECFHRIQSGIGLRSTDSPNSHLDTRDGRIWLEMEWRALERAIWTRGQFRLKAVEDALYFRSYRWSLFPDASTRERALELNEGLAEYTGVKLSAASLAEFAVRVDAALRDAPRRRTSFVRSFAYVSGPAYGFLLDAAGARWRRRLGAQSDLGRLLASAYALLLPPLRETTAVGRARAYDRDEVFAVETQREQGRQAHLAQARRRFIEGPVLVFSVGGEFNYSFNPNTVLAVDENSTLYEGDVQVTDVWGILRASNGVLLVREKERVVRVQVPAPVDVQARPLSGDAWTLELKPGWTPRPGQRSGDWTLSQEATQ